MATRAIVTVPRSVARGQAFEVKALVAHPMETGHRNNSAGQRMPRDIVRRLECRVVTPSAETFAFAADLHPAISANPFIAFWLSLDEPARLTFTWSGDRNFAHTETVTVAVA